MVDKQTTFDTCVAWLLAQGRASDNIFGCAYRGQVHGTKCAVGRLIPDAEYREEFDTGYHTLATVYAACPSLQAHDFELLRALQQAHDNAATATWFIEAFKLRALDVASLHGLSTGAING